MTTAAHTAELPEVAGSKGPGAAAPLGAAPGLGRPWAVGTRGAAATFSVPLQHVGVRGCSHAYVRKCACLFVLLHDKQPKGATGHASNSRVCARVVLVQHGVLKGLGVLVRLHVAMHCLAAFL